MSRTLALPSPPGSRGQHDAVPTFGQACEQVLAEVSIRRTDGTLRWYRDHFAALAKMLPNTAPLDAITVDVVETYVRKRLQKVKAATVNADLRALHRAFAVAIRRGAKIANVVTLVDKLTEAQPARHWFTTDELGALLRQVREAGDGPAYDLFLLAACTGLRRSEIARISVDDCHGEQLHVRGKCGLRVLPLAPQVQPALARMILRCGGRGLLLPTGVRAIGRHFRHWSRQFGEPRWHPHALRHSFATALVRQGERVDVVMRLLGHRSLATTLRYWHEHGPDAVAAVGRLQLAV